jgi:hypothetical protein
MGPFRKDPYFWRNARLILLLGKEFCERVKLYHVTSVTSPYRSQPDWKVGGLLPVPWNLNKGLGSNESG